VPRASWSQGCICYNREPRGERASTITKAVARALLRPFRGSVTWACQRGYLSYRVRPFLPWRWALEPFTIYGPRWKCRWHPTEFDNIGRQIFWSGLRRWERETAPVILEIIRSSRCFIDIGANCGIYTVLGCTVNPTVHVVAVEPVPKVCAALRRNVFENGYGSRVTILNVALGDSTGVVPFHEAEDATMGSLAPDGYLGQRGRVIEVVCKTLNSVIEELKVEPDFLKIDVEGFEGAVLHGADTVLSKFRPRIVLEANPGDPSEPVMEALSRHGYLFQIITDHGPEPRSSIIPEDAYRNWLC